VSTTSPWLAEVYARIGDYVRQGLALKDAVARAIREGFERTRLRQAVTREQPELDIEEE